MTKPVKLVFHSGVGVVTGANFMLSQEGIFKALIDCGLIQDISASVDNPKPFPYDPSEINFLFITHAHIDHIGRIPKLVREGFKGKIYSTPETKDISSIMLDDALKVMNDNLKRNNTPLIWDKTDLDKSFALWESVPYYNNFDIPGGKVCFKNSGHILGSSLIIFDLEEKGKIVFTGDLGNSSSILMKSVDFIEDAKYIVIESVYGDREHEDVSSSRQTLQSIIKKAVDTKSSILIPSFSLERTQVIIYEIKVMMDRGEMPKIPIFLDSPLAQSLMPVYNKYKNNFKKEIAGQKDVFSFPELKVGEVDDKVNPKVIISGAGMSTGGKILSHYIKYLPKKETTVVLTGYQSPKTLGRALEDGIGEVNIMGQKIKVMAKIETVKGYSSHADSEDLIDFISKSKNPEKVFVVLGEPKSSLSLVQKIRDYLGVNALYPEIGKEYELFI